MKPSKILQHGDTRVLIYQDECPCHPWSYDMGMICGLAGGWDENIDIFPYVVKRDEKGNRTTVIPDWVRTIDSPEGVREWLENLPKQPNGDPPPWMIAGLTEFDRYGGLVLHLDRLTGAEGCGSREILENLERYCGAMFIDIVTFNKMTGREWTDLDSCWIEMRETIKAEFEYLNAYFSGAFYWFQVEKKCDKCDSWVSNEAAEGAGGSCSQFRWMQPDPRPMLREMAEHWNQNDPDMAEIIKGIEEGRWNEQNG